MLLSVVLSFQNEAEKRPGGDAVTLPRLCLWPVFGVVLLGCRLDSQGQAEKHPFDYQTNRNGKVHMVQDFKREHLFVFYNTLDSIGAYVEIVKWPRGHLSYSVDGAALVYMTMDLRTNWYYAIQLPVATGHQIHVTERLEPTGTYRPNGSPKYHWPNIRVSDPIPLCVNKAENPVHPLLKETTGLCIPLNGNDSDGDGVPDRDDAYVEGDDPDLVAVQIRHPKGLPIALAWSNDIIHLYERRSKKYGLSATSRNARVGCNFSTNHPHAPYKGFDDEILYVEGISLGSTFLSLTGPGGITDRIKINVLKVDIDPIWDIVTEGDDSGDFKAVVSPAGLSGLNYSWSWQTVTNGGNNPSVAFSTPNDATTHVDQTHWYAVPDARCASNTVSDYQLWCTVSIGGAVCSNSARMSVQLVDPAAKTASSNLTLIGGPSRAYNSASNCWYVSGTGTLVRQCILYTNWWLHSNSEFTAKTQAHENQHSQDIISGFDGHNFVTVAEFYARIVPLTDPTATGLVNKINNEYLQYLTDEQAEYISLNAGFEVRAYNVSDGVAPDYYYSNCGRFTYP